MLIAESMKEANEVRECSASVCMPRNKIVRVFAL